MSKQFFDRDISWLSFNERVLSEAGKNETPLLERLKFLSIYSSNLDEFYRVRIPALMALHKITGERKKIKLLGQIKAIIESQQTLFGGILREGIIPSLQRQEVELVYDQPVPGELQDQTGDYFNLTIAAFVQRIYFKQTGDFFPENNKIYFAVSLLKDKRTTAAIVNIPSDSLPRFYAVRAADKQYLVFLDDIIRGHLSHIFPQAEIMGCWSFKITRDAELDLLDEYEGDIAEKLEKQITKRDLGLATRVLYDGAMPEDVLRRLVKTLQLQNSNLVIGGRYHNLKDLGDIPLNNPLWRYGLWEPVTPVVGPSVFRYLQKKDILLHPPYHSYEVVFRFFNEAVLDDEVTEIFVTLYRVAIDSRIAHALISAAHNGKKVMVFVELMARFDEANNIRWARKMKAAGIKMIYSIPGMKVHAKMALIKRRQGGRDLYYGLLGTGNLNESTARFYTDHILLTSNKDLLREMELLFLFLRKRKRPDKKNNDLKFDHLLVAQFNLYERLSALIKYETRQAQMGNPAAITVKLNNLEESRLIKALYRASAAGVKINLIVRGICRLIPGVAGMSENIAVRRIVGRYLEHGRIYIFHHGGDEQILIGSADWMERNICRRIEVCCPVYDERLRSQLKKIIQLELDDNLEAVRINEFLQNVPVPVKGKAIASQFETYQLIKQYE
ncbi:MAG TPA: polyphosphate kinase 1 [Chitinophagaceae bacterium]|nr:polyphosphate kinase 1 [Chitinophagaceae bacterium]